MATDDDADDDDDGDDDGDRDDDDEDADVDVDVDVDGDELAALFSHYCSSNKIKPPGRRLEQFRSSHSQRGTVDTFGCGSRRCDGPAGSASASASAASASVASASAASASAASASAHGSRMIRLGERERHLSTASPPSR